MPTFYAPSPPDTGEWRRVPPAERSAHAERAAEALRQAPGPVYAAPGGRPEIRGFGTSRDGVDHITLATDDITVDTSFGPRESPEDAARMALASMGLDTAWPARSQPAIAVWADARQRARLEASASAEAQPVSIEVDGEARTFVKVETGACWAAACDGILVTGSDAAVPESLRVV